MNRQKNDSVLHHHKSIRRYTKSSDSSTYVRETLPTDIIIEIISRLPANSIAICRLVSKQWSSILRSPDFTESFLTRSLPRPRLLFTFRFGRKCHLLSSPQPRNFDENRMLNGKIDRVSMIWNPSTGQQIPLPKLGVTYSHSKSFLGYDPIEKQFKVLCITSSKDYQVLTLGTGGELSWRKIECSFPHYPPKGSNGICTNGVLYYKNSNSMIVCFHVRSEEFSFIEIKIYVNLLSLINYKGKLGVLVRFPHTDLAQLWVLDDTKNVEWSKHNFVFPNTTFEAIRLTDTGEILCASSRSTCPFYVYYYNLEKKRFREVQIEGIEDKVLMVGPPYRPSEFFIFPNHIENVMFLK